MDDPTRTQQTLDKLADLFLTNTTSTSSLDAARNEDRSKDRPPLKPPHLKPTTVSASHGEDTDHDHSPHRGFPQLNTKPFDNGDTEPGVFTKQFPGSMGRASTPHGDGPIRVSPEAATRNGGSRMADGATQQQASGQETLVEAVLLGNLPGTGGPWLTQYAQRLARERGAVGVLSIDEQAVDVDLVTARRHRPTAATRLAEQHAEDPQALTHVLAELSQSEETGPIRTWLIHIPTPIDMQSFGRAWELPRWTLLCGADDAAVVGAYRTLKQLCVSPWADRLDGYNHPRVGVMVMGSDEGAAKGVAIKLNHTANSFLDTPVELVGWQKQMQPVCCQPIGRFFSDDQDLWSQVQVFLHDMADGFADARGLMDRWRDRVPHNVNTPEPDFESQDINSLPMGVDELTMPHQALQPDAGEGWDIDPAMLKTPDDTDAVSDARQQAAVACELDLIELLPFDAVLLEGRCPQHEHIRLMLDQAGRLHLVASDTAEGERRGADLGGAASLRSLIVDLMHTRDWVCEHFQLLQMAHSGLLLDRQAEPVLRVFTDQAKAAVALVGQLGSAVKLHLLQKAVVGQDEAWCACELN